MSVTSKIRVFMPGAAERFHSQVPQLEQLIHSQVDILTEQQLEGEPAKGKDVQVAFYSNPRYGNPIFDYKEKGWLPDLALVCNHGVGVNHLPFDRLRSLGLRLTNTPDVLSDSTADMAVALMLASGRQFKLGMDIAMKLPNTQKQDVFTGMGHILGQDICYSSLGIVGMGSIGYKIAQRAKAFNMDIHYHNRSQRLGEEEAAVGARYHADLTSMLGLCDFVIISCPLTPQTRNMFGKEQFNVMRNTAHLINIARGAVVNTDDLVEALTSKKIHAAALDVTEPEPLPEDHPLLKLENVIVLPHWATATKQTRGKMVQLMIDNAKAYLDGKPLLTEIKL